MPFNPPISSTIVMQRNENNELIIRWKDSLAPEAVYQEQTTPCPINFGLFWNPDNNNWYPIGFSELIPSNWKVYQYEIGA